MRSTHDCELWNLNGQLVRAYFRPLNTGRRACVARGISIRNSIPSSAYSAQHDLFTVFDLSGFLVVRSSLSNPRPALTLKSLKCEPQRNGQTAGKLLAPFLSISVAAAS